MVQASFCMQHLLELAQESAELMRAWEEFQLINRETR